jgi:hypothetical protein
MTSKSVFVVTCDRCGTESLFDDQATADQFEITFQSPADFAHEMPPRADLCRECARSHLQWWSRPNLVAKKA